MKLAKTILGLFAVSLFAVAFAMNTRADDLNKRTIITFTQPVEIPGQVLPAGTYTFELLEHLSYRHIVRIFNEDRTEVFATVMAIPNYRLAATDANYMTFAERPGNEPSALKAWFYPGDTFGHEFVYPKTRATELAVVTHENVPAMENQPANVEEMKNAPIVVETPEQNEVTVAEAFPAEAPATEALAPSPEPAAQAELPKTASPVPLIAFLGVLSISVAIALKHVVG